MTTLETILINKQRNNFIAGFQMLNSDYAIIQYNTVTGGCYWSYDIIAKESDNSYELCTMVHANNVNQAIAKVQFIISSTDDFSYVYDDVLSKSGSWYKKRRKEKTDNRQYKEKYTKLLNFLKTL